MKQGLVIFILLLVNHWANAQDEAVDNYFNKKGVVLLANCAHPTNTIEAGTYTVYDQSVIVDIVYKEGIRTKLKVTRQGYGFSKVSVLYDGDYIAPFTFVKIVTDIILAQYKDSDAKDEIERNLENMLNRKLKDWNGADWTLFMLNLDYFSN